MLTNAWRGRPSGLAPTSVISAGLPLRRAVPHRRAVERAEFMRIGVGRNQEVEGGADAGVIGNIAADRAALPSAAFGRHQIRAFRRDERPGLARPPEQRLRRLRRAGRRHVVRVRAPRRKPAGRESAQDRISSYTRIISCAAACAGVCRGHLRTSRKRKKRDRSSKKSDVHGLS